MRLNALTTLLVSGVASAQFAIPLPPILGVHLLPDAALPTPTPAPDPALVAARLLAPRANKPADECERSASAIAAAAPTDIPPEIDGLYETNNPLAAPTMFCTRTWPATASSAYNSYYSVAMGFYSRAYTTFMELGASCEGGAALTALISSINSVVDGCKPSATMVWVGGGNNATTQTQQFPLPYITGSAITGAATGTPKGAAAGGLRGSVVGVVGAVAGVVGWMLVV